MKNTAVGTQSRQKILAWGENDFRTRFYYQKITPMCSICSEPLSETAGCSYSCCSCSAKFHLACVSQWATQSYGEIIRLRKTQCPHCEKPLDLSLIPATSEGKIFTSEEITVMDSSKLFKQCKTCRVLFECGDRSCEANEAEMPDRCNSCESKIFECPKCKLQLEHSGGCRAFACCLYGWHGCTGSSCLHGSSEFTKFCGQRWHLDEHLALAEPEQGLRRNPIGEVQTEAMCLAAVRQDGWLLMYVHVKTPRICLAAVQRNGNALQVVPEGLRTPELCMAAVQRNGDALRYVPMELMTLELCMSAVQENGNALQFVPEGLRTPEICLAAVQQYGGALRSVPEGLKTPKLCMSAVQQYGGALWYVPEELKTPEICLAAVQRNGNALGYVPEELRTPEICLAAVQQNGYALRYVPEELKTPELCMAAVRRNGSTLMYVPEELKTPKLCMSAVQRNGNALEYVPEELKTPELCMAAFQRDGLALRYVPMELKTP